MKRIGMTVVPLFGVLALAACNAPPPPQPMASPHDTPEAKAEPDAQRARAVLEARSGSQAGGALDFVATADGVRVSGEISGLTADSVHAFHIHETGDCSAEDASSAGGHFNPTAQPHGRAGQGEHHLGDQDNLQADAAGVAHVDAEFAGVTLGDGGANDVMGKSVVVHADPDDYTSQPAGNAGARIACGVIR
ncbi:superoxide dismutase family protein [Luteimonas sp. e5]